MPTSYKTEVFADREWCSNGLRFATREEAEASGHELLGRWFVPTASRAAESDDAVTHRFNLETGRNEPLPAPLALPQPAPLEKAA